MKILISSGSNNFYLIPLASELNKNKEYEINVYTSAYPREYEIKLIKFFKFHYFKIVARFIQRREKIDSNKIYDYRLSELLFKIGSFLKKYPKFQDSFEKLAYKKYSSNIHFHLRKIRPMIYHYRCAYGLNSVDYSKEFTNIQICDHSIAHPLFLYNQLYSNIKHINPLNIPKEENFNLKKLPYLLRLMYEDIHNAENILVNSDFVKRTLIHYGINDTKIKVIYLGCDEKFLSFNPNFSRDRKPKENLIYAGTWCERKGVKFLAEAMIDLKKEINLTIVGATKEDIYKITPNLKNSNVSINLVGYLNRKELSRILCSHKIFIFPSLSEGSARVIFEAMANGCCILTTQNSGSIVQNYQNGLIFKEGSSNDLKNSIKEILSKTDKEIEDIGEHNFYLVRKNFNQKVYGEKVCDYYKSLVETQIRDL